MIGYGPAMGESRPMEQYATYRVSVDDGEIYQGQFEVEAGSPEIAATMALNQAAQEWGIDVTNLEITNIRWVSSDGAY